MVLKNFALEKFVVRENVLEKVSYNHVIDRQKKKQRRERVGDRDKGIEGRHPQLNKNC